MVNLTHAERPAEQRPAYRFFSNAETGRAFKALHEIEADGRNNPVIKISVTEVDASGKAVVDPVTDKPRISYHSHTFTEVEISAPDFDLEARVNTVLSTIVEGIENAHAARSSLSKLSAKWSDGKKLNTSKLVPVAEIETNK